MSDEDWAKYYQEYVFVKSLELKQQELTFKNALIEVLNQAFAEQDE